MEPVHTIVADAGAFADFQATVLPRNRLQKCRAPITRSAKDQQELSFFDDSVEFMEVWVQCRKVLPSEMG